MKTLNRLPWGAKTEPPEPLSNEDIYAIAVRQYHQDLRDNGVPEKEWSAPDNGKSVFYAEDLHVAVDLRGSSGSFIASYWLYDTSRAEYIAYSPLPYEESDWPEGIPAPGDISAWQKPGQNPVILPVSEGTAGQTENTPADYGFLSNARV